MGDRYYEEDFMKILNFCDWELGLIIKHISFVIECFK